jgi:hypothetical protein
MKKSIRFLGTALLVTGMGLGGTALTAGAASAAPGTAPAGLQVTGHSWSDDDNCWRSEGWDSNWRHHKDCRDDGDHHGKRHHDDGDHHGNNHGDD